MKRRHRRSRMGGRRRTAVRSACAAYMMPRRTKGKRRRGGPDADRIRRFRIGSRRQRGGRLYFVQQRRFGNAMPARRPFTEILGNRRIAMQLTEEQLAQFDEEGYLFLPEVFSRKETAVLMNEVPGIRSEEHTSELQSLMRISYGVVCLKNKKT